MPVYLITASSGIGAETARLLARTCRDRARPKILLAGLDRAECTRLAEELRDLGAEAHFRAGDLSVPRVAPAAVAACVSRFGRVDALFNVAGISGRKFGDGPVHLCTEDGWARVLDTNLTTQYRMCREAVRVMLKQKPGEDGQRGVILNMASVLALHPEPLHFDTAAYAASKGAILALTRSMAASYARQKIRVNAIAPGLTPTAMSHRVSEDAEMRKFLRKRQPLSGGPIPLADIAAACVFLLTGASHAVTGQVLGTGAGWDLV